MPPLNTVVLKKLVTCSARNTVALKKLATPNMLKNGPNFIITLPDSQLNMWISYFQSRGAVRPPGTAPRRVSQEAPPPRQPWADVILPLILITLPIWVAFSNRKRNIATQHALTNTTHTHKYRRSSRVQHTLTNTEEAHEHRRS